jgi:glyoxylase-like metal-dependent hydrolase (beta-lactamase superfamily II)
MPEYKASTTRFRSSDAIKPDVRSLFHAPTNTITHIVSDPSTKRTAIIDPVLDFDQAAARTHTEFADQVIECLNEDQLKVDWILETHIHADHLSGAQYLKERLGAPIAVGNNISIVQQTFAPMFHLSSQFNTDGRQFDHLFMDGEKFKIGSLDGSVLGTPGHTPACVSYLINDTIFVGDTLFRPDYGTARCDFPGGDAGMLYDSIEKILSLPDDTRMFLCHDYPSAECAPVCATTVGEEKSQNVHVAGLSRQDFIKLRADRDRDLSVPQLILPSIQVNMNAGEMPVAEDNGISYLKIPLNQF